MWLKKIFFVLVFTNSLFLLAQEISIIPEPVHLERGTGYFTLTDSTKIIVPSDRPGVLKAAKYLVDKTKSATGFDIGIVNKGEFGILFMLNSKTDKEINDEGYRLSVAPEKIIIRANTDTGIFYGIQTLLQLLPPEIESSSLQNISWKIPEATITDFPRFKWRGLMLDVSRHFFAKDYVKAYIDQMARYKFNRFHWHLTDDNGWRLEIKSLPKLTEVGAWRVPRTGTFGSHEPPKPGEKTTYGGFYTHEDIKEIVQYALDRHIQVLPEIDVPGHSMAAVASYPELCVTKDSSITVNPGSKFSTWHGGGKFTMHIDNTLNPSNEQVYSFLDKVFTEVADLFPFEYIHMGGDECYKGYWEKDQNVKAFMAKNSIKDVQALEAYFANRVSEIIASKNKKMIGWDEILEGGLPKDAAVMSWRGTKGGIEASHLKHPVVMSPWPYYYLDMRQGSSLIEPPVYSTSRLKDVYSFDIIAPEMDANYILGGQANLWTEQVPTAAHAEYMTYPRAFAVSEGLWSPKSKKDWQNFIPKVEHHFNRFNSANRNYARSMYDPGVKVEENKPGNLVITLSPELEDLDIHYTIDNTIPNKYAPVYKAPITFTKDVDMLRFITYRDGQPIGRLISIKTEDLETRVRK